MKAVIVSDLHIGSRYFLDASFDRFLDNIPENSELILNGDVIDNLYTNLSSFHRSILDRIAQLSLKQPVIWVRGNHDNGYAPKDFGNIRFKKAYSINQKLFIAHGDYFDEVMPRSQMFMKAFRKLHNLRVKLGARPVHVAEYAKNWHFLYRHLRRNVMLNAVNYARQKGYQAVTCGHTHYAEDKRVGGIRYINTGAWTEMPTHFLEVNGPEMKLKTVSQ
jgi:UDP-2,3-diacylglucosamine pyrophosphatase LpxH